MTVVFTLLACVQFSSPAGTAAVPSDFGGHSEGETPLPIPNRAVKPLRADGTWWATAWESRSPPVLIARRAASRGGSSAFRAVSEERRSVQGSGAAGPAARASGGGLQRGSRKLRRGRPLGAVPGRRRGGPSRTPPIRPHDERMARGRAVHGARPRGLARDRTRPASRSRSRDRPR